LYAVEIQTGLARPDQRRNNRNGRHKRAFDALAIDVLAVYCPSPRTFVYLLADELPSTGVYLRLSKARNGQVKRTRDSSDYRDPSRMFEPVAQGCEPREGRPLGFEPGSGSALCELPAGASHAHSVDGRTFATAKVRVDTPP
jgi:hypothetical protein